MTPGSVDEEYSPQGLWATRRPALRAVGKLLAVQAAITVIAALAWLVGSGTEAGAASLVGGAIAVAPTAYFAARAFAPRPGAPPRRLLRALYAGEAVKLILTAGLFIIALRWFGGQFLPLITTYAVALLAYGLVFASTLRT